VTSPFEELLGSIRACRICRDAPRYGSALPHEPRPVIQAERSARICIIGQAPGAREHAAGRPFMGASGIRLRAWLGLDEAAFYDASRVALVPMGFCFPGNDAKGGDLPPRRECREAWHALVLEQLTSVELTLLIGQYAQARHLSAALTAGGVTATVQRWKEIYRATDRHRLIPLPHPSWRNTGWLKHHPWFEAELLPVLRSDVAALLAPGSAPS
jgi:uracil-DNA glycosylase